MDLKYFEMIDEIWRNIVNKYQSWFKQVLFDGSFYTIKFSSVVPYVSDQRRVSVTAKVLTLNDCVVKEFMLDKKWPGMTKCNMNLKEQYRHNQQGMESD